MSGRDLSHSLAGKLRIVGGRLQQMLTRLLIRTVSVRRLQAARRALARSPQCLPAD
jgi:hypothetical protein